MAHEGNRYLCWNVTSPEGIRIHATAGPRTNLCSDCTHVLSFDSTEIVPIRYLSDLVIFSPGQMLILGVILLDDNATVMGSVTHYDVGAFSGQRKYNYLIIIGLTYTLLLHRSQARSEPLPIKSLTCQFHFENNRRYEHVCFSQKKYLRNGFSNECGVNTSQCFLV